MMEYIVKMLEWTFSMLESLDFLFIWTCCADCVGGTGFRSTFSQVVYIMLHYFYSTSSVSECIMNERVPVEILARVYCSDFKKKPSV